MGTLSKSLRERLGDGAKLSDEAAAHAVIQLRKQLVNLLADDLAEHATSLVTHVKEQHGTAGVQTVIAHIHDWVLEIAEEVLKHPDDLLDELRHTVHGTKAPEADSTGRAKHAMLNNTAAALRDMEQLLRLHHSPKLAKRVQRVTHLLERL